jgi:uracil phosphoribosyltransferase
LINAILVAQWLRLIEMLKKNGCLSKRWYWIAAPEDVRVVNETHPDVTEHTAALGSHLDEHGYIPGLGGG